jgi:hypothetical protein
MRGIISGTVVALTLAVAGCTTDGTETVTKETKLATKAKTINYTAWACEDHKKTVNGLNCQKFRSAYGPGREKTKQAVLSVCPGNCRIILVRPGCVPLTLDNRRVLRPKC